MCCTRRGYVLAAEVSIGAPDQVVDNANPRGDARSPPAAKLHAGRFSLVVLPFVNLSGSQTDDHLADDLVNKVMEVRADGSVHVR
jgi:hypothetical protein